MPSLNATILVNVTIIDVNDNVPRFVNTSTTALLPDNSPARQIVSSCENVSGTVLLLVLLRLRKFSRLIQMKVLTHALSSNYCPMKIRLQLDKKVYCTLVILTIIIFTR